MKTALTMKAAKVTIVYPDGETFEFDAESISSEKTFDLYGPLHTITLETRDEPSKS